MEIFNAQNGLLYIVQADANLNCDSYVVTDILEYERQDILKAHRWSLIHKYVDRVLKKVLLFNFDLKLDSQTSYDVRQFLQREILKLSEKQYSEINYASLKQLSVQGKKEKLQCLEVYKGKKVPYPLFKLMKY